MFHPDNSAIGTDLLAYDIQRGRDTGLPPYNKIREKCGMPVAESFNDLADVIQSDVSKYIYIYHFASRIYLENSSPICCCCCLYFF